MSLAIPYLLLALGMFVAADVILGAWRYICSEQFIRDCREAAKRDRGNA